MSRVDRKLIALFALALTEIWIPVAARCETTIDKIKERKAISLGYRESSVPFSYIDLNGKPTGFSIDLCQAIADHARDRYGINGFQVNYVSVNPSNRVPLIQNGTIDIECGSTTITPEKLKQVAFSIATFVSQARWMVTTDSKITSASDLKGKTVVISQGSASFPAAQKSDHDGQLGLRFVMARDHAESVLTLRSGRAAGFMEEDVLLAGLRATAPDPKQLTILDESFSTFRDALMLRKDDPDFKSMVDGVIRRMMASGEFKALYAKWFTQPIPPSGKNLQLQMSDALQQLVASPSSEPAPVE